MIGARATDGVAVRIDRSPGRRIVTPGRGQRCAGHNAAEVAATPGFFGRKQRLLQLSAAVRLARPQVFTTVCAGRSAEVVAVMMCGVCGNEMVPLFLSCVCDYCEKRPATADHHRGYVVWRGFLGPGFPHYVFSNRQSAERWRRGQGQNSGEIREVLSPEPFRWRPSRGTLRDIEFADHLFEIFPDHRYRKAPHRAFLAPTEQSESKT